jgi:hypothetical protein
MSQLVTFYLGPGGTHLASRSLVITRMMGAGDDSAPAAQYSNAAIGNTTENVTATLPGTNIWQAVHFDTAADGTTSVPQVLNFHTGSLQFPGPKKSDGYLSIIAMTDESSSSLSLSSSSWSSTSASSQSSASSSSSVSTSSASTSSSSISTSSQSSSQSSSSESSSSQSSASSQSVSSASSSSSVSSSSWST